MKEIIIPENYNYIAVFLTFACNLNCSYCINHFESGNFSKKHLSGGQWVKVLNRITSRDDLPITIQGGEPTLHKDFIYIINHIREDLNIDILTNLQFDIYSFIEKVNPDRLKRNAPYASIRVSYHPTQMNLDDLIEKTLKMQEAGFSMGLFGVLHPEQEDEILSAKEECLKLKIDFRIKEFLGHYNGKLYGTYLYPDACTMEKVEEVLCKTTELIVGPGGEVYRCHHDLYEGVSPVGNLMDVVFQIKEIFKPCSFYGFCNPCDIKVKTNRFQQYGHTSVEIIKKSEKKQMRA
jgi:MoaA/NifB/PqqE/SkfB family radical SAM enzyme